MTHPQYLEKIRQLALKAREWARAHPDKTPNVAFNYGEDVAVVCTFTEAVTNGFIVLNDDGREMVAAIVEGIPPREAPTATMIRLALDIMEMDDLDKPAHGL